MHFLDWSKRQSHSGSRDTTMASNDLSLGGFSIVSVDMSLDDVIKQVRVLYLSRPEIDDYI
jgi:hypothetical protein|tara:strand:- start:5652 stop:5834 length:183 start_codon:yes stop_codon:yes gene_type:complete